MVDRKEPTTVKTRSVYAVAIALILGACIFVATDPELLSLASGGSPPKFLPGECVTGFHLPGESWVIVQRMPEHVVETYRVEEVTSGRQQAIQVQQLRPCETEPAR